MNALTKEMQLNVWLADEISPDQMMIPLTGEAAAEVVETLKAEADRFWLIDPNRSLEYAERIFAIGQARNDGSQMALGLMARGDALKFLGNLEEAWDMLEKSGLMFKAAGDEVGWARTRIGRLYLGVKLNRISDTLVQAEEAREIFLRYGEHEKLLRLSMQTALAYTWLGKLDDALSLYHAALSIAESLGKTGRRYFSQLYLNIGLTYETLGDFREALTYYERARSRVTDAKEARNNALLDINIALIERAQGNYPGALDTLYRVITEVANELPWETVIAKRDILECYLELNRYSEARELARQVVTEYRAFNAPYDLARTLLHMATAEAANRNYEDAEAAVDEADQIFNSLGALSWVATTQLLRGQIALREGDAHVAFRQAAAAASYFKSAGQQVNRSKSSLLQGQALLAMDDRASAAEAGIESLHIAKRYNVPSLRYGAHLLLGQVHEESQVRRAMRHYQAAAATVERVQRGLSITLRPGFLEDKGEASRALIALQLKAGEAEGAFETLERAKSQVLLGYLTNRESLYWLHDDPRGLALIEELNRLRSEHQWFYRLANESPPESNRPGSIQPEQALVEIGIRERRMRAITEQLYLLGSGNRQVNAAPTPSLKDIQHGLDKDVLLVEFYNDGTGLWAFVLDRQKITVHSLPIVVDKLNYLLLQLQSNVAATLQIDPQSVSARRLAQSIQRILQRLYALLIEPLELSISARQRLLIVPYGALHYLPFHLLYDGSQYLIERCEVVILPASGLVMRPAIRQKPGALIVAHSRDGQLPHTLDEAQIVRNLFGGDLYANEQAQRSVLQAAPLQILHIAAHGQHRLDEPDLSYLQLADGQLYSDDLLQQNLGYELVTLSGCETGRANVSGGDELIGLGRGFLYAGAGALLASLWKVTDDHTLSFMMHMYQALFAGESKAAALRKAQQKMLAEDPELHPAFWGAFQLIGDACPLSTYSE